jgi:hypothetical protein
MVRGTHHMTLPNPHEGGIGRHFLVRILREAGISHQVAYSLGEKPERFRRGRLPVEMPFGLVGTSDGEGRK